MAALADLELALTVRGSDGSIQAAHAPPPLRWTPNVLKRESVSLAGGSTFTPFSPPGNAVLLVLVFGETPTGILTLKGVVGDATGVQIAPASGFLGFPLILPLNVASTTVGILNAGGVISADLYWV